MNLLETPLVLSSLAEVPSLASSMGLSPKSPSPPQGSSGSLLVTQRPLLPIPSLSCCITSC